MKTSKVFTENNTIKKKLWIKLKYPYLFIDP